MKLHGKLNQFGEILTNLISGLSLFIKRKYISPTLITASLSGVVVVQ